MRKTYSERMYWKQKRVELWIKDAHSAATIYQSSFDTYLDGMKRIFESKDYKTLPQHRRSYLRGVYDTLFGQLQNTFEWVLTGPDGRRFDRKNDDWIKESREYKESMVGHHVWPKAWEKGEYVLFN